MEDTTDRAPQSRVDRFVDRSHLRGAVAMDSGTRSLRSLGRNDQEATRRATEGVASIPRDSDGPVFREPWEAQAFAMALALHARGLFTWNEWAAALAEEIKRAQALGDPDTGDTYYRHWLATLENIVSA